MTDAINDIKKSRRGRPATGQGTPVLVRLQPDLLEVLDRFAGELGKSRPEAMRAAFSQWAGSAGFVPSHPRIREHPVMIFLPKEIMRAATEATGENDLDDAVNAILHDWLNEKGYLPQDSGGGSHG